VPVEATELEVGVEGFGRIVEGVATIMVDLVKATAAGERFRLPAQASVKAGDPVSEAEYKAAVVGYAMQLDFLGRKGGIRAPQVVTSWIVDKDLAAFTPTVQICALLNKNQLSDLYQRLKIIRDQAQRTKRTGAKDFFQGIMSAAAGISRDPIQFSKQPNLSLQQLGVLGEYLDDLPYKKGILRLTEEDWLRMSLGEQQTFIDTLKSKMRRYEEYHDDVENWESFGAADPGEAVYRIPLSMLP
jgi:serine/threonine-protein kinase PpkA